MRLPLISLLAVAALIGPDSAYSKADDGVSDLPSSKNIVQWSSKNWQSHLESHPTWIVEFYAPWCGACKAFAGSYASLADRLPEHTRAARVNVDQDSGLAMRFMIFSLPTLFYIDGDAVYNVQLSRRDLSDVLERLQTGEIWDESNRVSAWKNPLGIVGMILGFMGSISQYFNEASEFVGLYLPQWAAKPFIIISCVIIAYLIAWILPYGISPATKAVSEKEQKVREEYYDKQGEVRSGEQAGNVRRRK